MSKQTLITIIIGGLMVLSVFGIMFSGYNSGQMSDEYNGYKFRRAPLGWYLKVNEQKIEFTYLPQDLEVLDMRQDVINKVGGARVIYVTFDPESKIVSNVELARLELAKSLALTKGIQTIPGVIQESEQYDLPVVGCENATELLPVISFVEANKTNAYLDRHCVVIETDDYSAVAMKDRLIYGLLGIIDQEAVGAARDAERAEAKIAEPKSPEEQLADPDETGEEEQLADPEETGADEYWS